MSPLRDFLCNIMFTLSALHYLVLICEMMAIVLTCTNFFVNSETVKFGHVTFFWNGNRSGYFNAELEEYVEIPSDSGITFNEQPLMKALQIAEKARDAILSGKFDQVTKWFSVILGIMV